MGLESTTKQLLSVVENAREHLWYLQELGVENCEDSPDAHTGSVSQSLTRSEQPSTSQPLHAHEALAANVQPAESLAQVKLTPAARATAPQETSALFARLFEKEESPLPESTESFDQIWTAVGNCTRCPLAEGRTNIVHTEGDQKARLMFVGEAPGADEDAQARPFVGRAGQLLTKIIEAIGMKRDDVLIGNVNRCRPPGNRAPTPDEVAMCKPFLLREIAAARPDVIVVMGNTAMKNLLETKEGITRARGQFQNFKGIKVMPTFHPAYLLRDPSKKRETWDDLRKVRDYLESTSGQKP
jgi:DNA polymerase